MHIPDGMLNGAICPVTLAIAAGSLALSAIAASKSDKKTSAMKFAAVASTIFVLQMLNFPISSGTSGHFLGAAFAAWALGTAPGILAMALVISVQALFFGDGGMHALGANILCMSVVGAGSSGLLMSLMKKSSRKIPESLNLGLAAFISIVSASALCSVFLFICGSAPIKTLMSSMVLTHMKIGFAEAGISLAIMGLMVSVSESKKSTIFKSCVVSLMLAAGCGLSLLASDLPDGLEYTAEKLGFMGKALTLFQGIMPDYVMPGMESEIMAKIFAAAAGIIITAAMASLMKPLFQKSAE